MPWSSCCSRLSRSSRPALVNNTGLAECPRCCSQRRRRMMMILAHLQVVAASADGPTARRGPCCVVSREGLARARWCAASQQKHLHAVVSTSASTRRPRRREADDRSSEASGWRDGAGPKAEASVWCKGNCRLGSPLSPPEWRVALIRLEARHQK